MFKYDEEKETIQALKIDSFFSKTRELLIKYLPKYDELDSYIVLLLVILSYSYYQSFRDLVVNLLFLDPWMILFVVLIFIGLLIGSYYSFRTNVTASPKLKEIVTLGAASVITALAGGALIHLISTNDVDNKILLFSTWVFIALSAIKVFISFAILYSEDTKAADYLFSEKDAKLKQIIITTLSLPLLVYISSKYFQNQNIYVVCLNIYSITSLIVRRI